MSEVKRLTINSSSIKPLINSNETQIIFQRHCKYDRNNSKLIDDSIHIQQCIAETFIKSIKNQLSSDEIKNTYFLFSSSNTTSNDNFKRCVETTNIVINILLKFLEENNISKSNIINLSYNYNNMIHEDKNLIEPKMFIDDTRYLEFLKQKHGGINKDFWIDFEEDLSKLKREQLKAEGPDQIVERANHYIKVLQRYSNLFHSNHKNSRLIIWNGTHYDLISPLVKQNILGFKKSDVVDVEYCGGISLLLDKSNYITSNINGVTYPFDFQDTKQLHRHF